MRRAAVLFAFVLGTVGASLSACGDYGGSCCRECKSGKPCGDSCIASGSTCNSPPGCACYAYDEDTESETG